jgi:hypothetical protein
MVTVDGSHCDAASNVTRHADFSDSVKRLRFKPSPEFPDQNTAYVTRGRTAENVEHDRRHRVLFSPSYRLYALNRHRGRCPGADRGSALKYGLPILIPIMRPPPPPWSFSCSINQIPAVTNFRVLTVRKKRLLDRRIQSLATHWHIRAPPSPHRA